MGRALECREEKVVGKPYEGKPHVRIDVAGDGDQDKAELLRHRQTKEAATDRLDLRLRRHTLTTDHSPNPDHPHLPSAGVGELSDPKARELYWFDPEKGRQFNKVLENPPNHWGYVSTSCSSVGS